MGEKLSVLQLRICEITPSTFVQPFFSVAIHMLRQCALHLHLPVFDHFVFLGKQEDTFLAFTTYLHEINIISELSEH